MPNLDLSIAKIMHGDTPVLRIMEGDTRVWPSGTDVVIDGVLTNVTSSISVPGTAPLNSSLTITLTPNSSHIINQISVTMGGVDITSTAYNEGVITIASVTGDIIIHASAIEVITFEDANVKAICVSNWGGNVIEGEITPAEAAAVTSLNDKFKSNTTITSFKELRYFTGITSFSTTIVQSYAAGQFYRCTNLEEVIMPAVNVPSVAGLFRACSKLKSLDLSPITSQTLSVSNICREARALEEITFPNCNISGDAVYLFRLCTKLHTINFGTSDWEGITNYASGFYQCSALKYITGTPTGFNHNFELNWCPLTMDSLRIILNGLYDYVGHGSTTTRTLRINANLLNSISTEDMAIATSKGWTLYN